jgi:Domain of unknown function (DUF397)
VPETAEDQDELPWRTATYSGGGNCVEFAELPDGGGVAIRDSKDRAGAVLLYTAAEWTAFVAGVRAGEFDLS